MEFLGIFLMHAPPKHPVPNTSLPYQAFIHKQAIQECLAKDVIIVSLSKNM